MAAAGGGCWVRDPTGQGGCTHPCRAALHLHPDGLGDAVLPLPQPLPWGQGHPSLAAVAPPEPPAAGAGHRGLGLLRDPEWEGWWGRRRGRALLLQHGRGPGDGL